MYRTYSINRPGRLLNFWSLRVGTYSRWALIRGWAYTQIFENYFRELFFQHSTLLPKSKISGWMVRISEKFPKVWELFRENTVPIAAVSKVS